MSLTIDDSRAIAALMDALENHEGKHEVVIVGPVPVANVNDLDQPLGHIDCVDGFWRFTATTGGGS